MSCCAARTAGQAVGGTARPVPDTRSEPLSCHFLFTAPTRCLNFTGRARMAVQEKWPAGGDRGMTRPTRPATVRPIHEADPVPDVPIRELEQLGDTELLAMIRSLPRESPLRNAASEVLVSRYRPLVKSCVRRFQNSPEPYEDPLQVGYAGPIKAINNYHPEAGDAPRRGATPSRPRRRHTHPPPHT